MDQKPRVGFGIMILKDSKILLGKRHDDPVKASSALHGEGTWTMPGGKLHFKENPEDGAVRETLEETGIEIEPSNLKLISVGNEVVTDAHFITLGFLCEKFIGSPEVKEPDEITEWKWFDIDNLPKKMFLPSLKMVQNYLNGVIY